MRIGIDATCWANPRGYGRFTRHLLPELVALAPEDTFVCFLDQRAAGQFDLTAPNLVRRVVDRMPSWEVDYVRLNIAARKGSDRH